MEEIEKKGKRRNQQRAMRKQNEKQRGNLYESSSMGTQREARKQAKDNRRKGSRNHRRKNIKSSRDRKDRNMKIKMNADDASDEGKGGDGGGGGERAGEGRTETEEGRKPLILSVYLAW